MAEHVAENRWRALVNRLLAASPDFTRIWERREVVGPENMAKLIMQPDVGLLRFHHASYWLAPLVGTRLVTYSPMDDDTSEKLETLARLRGEGRRG
jgi:hypothetical protein